MSWYRRYRPVTIAGLHLKSVREQLQTLMRSGHMPHALLFAGPKGTGKTSTARIIGAMVNDPQNADLIDQIFFGKTKKAAMKEFVEPDVKNELVQRIYKGASLVVNEIDAASYRGIDDIRQLKERLNLPPPEGKIAVYILDEVHMLTSEAFNALLKVLEEPPPHVMFILATTELHKIPETIASRATLIQFHRASDEEIGDSLRNILDQEKIAYDDEALVSIAHVADGSFRDAVKLLETIAIGQKKVTTEIAQNFLAETQTQTIQAFLEAIVEKNEKTVVDICKKLRSQDVDQTAFQRSLLTFLHTDLLNAIEGRSSTFSEKISHYLLTQFHSLPIENQVSIPFLSLELKALEIIFKSKEKNGGSGQPIKESKKILEVLKNVDIPAETVPAHATLPPQIKENENWANGADLVQKWDMFLQRVGLKNSSIEAILRSAKPVSAEGNTTKVEVYYEFHREQLQQPKFLKLLEEAVIAVLGGKILFEFILAPHAQAGAALSTVSGKVDDEQLIQLAKEILV